MYHPSSHTRVTDFVQIPAGKGKASDRENDRKRSLSVSSVANSDSGAESDGRDNAKDKKGRKNSVFGNLFRKKSRKPSKDDETGREEEHVDTKSSTKTTVSLGQESKEETDALRNDWEAPAQYDELENVQNGKSVGSEQSDSFPNPLITSAVKESVNILFR